MDEIVVTCVRWSEDGIQDGIQKCMHLYGYGYTHTIHAEVTEDGDGLAFLATEYVAKDSVTLDYMYQYFHGMSNVDKFLDAKGNRITLKFV